MKIPEQVKVGGVTYSIKRSAATAVASDCWGNTSHHKQFINIDSDAQDDRQSETMLHELLHCAAQVSGLSQFITDKNILTEEQIVNCLSSALYQIIVDNKLDFRL